MEVSILHAQNKTKKKLKKHWQYIKITEKVPIVADDTGSMYFIFDFQSEYTMVENILKV